MTRTSVRYDGEEWGFVSSLLRVERVGSSRRRQRSYYDNQNNSSCCNGYSDGIFDLAPHDCVDLSSLKYRLLTNLGPYKYPLPQSLETNCWTNYKE